MKDLLQTLVTALVDDAEGVAIVEEMRGQTQVFKVSVQPEDMGKVIGKQGKTIRSIRSVIQAAANVRHQRVRVELLDEGRAEQPGE